MSGSGDPVFIFDGWRRTVPGCRSRRNLHDRHSPLLRLIEDRYLARN